MAFFISRSLGKIRIFTHHFKTNQNPEQAPVPGDYFALLLYRINSKIHQINPPGNCETPEKFRFCRGPDKNRSLANSSLIAVGADRIPLHILGVAGRVVDMDVPLVLV